MNEVYVVDACMGTGKTSAMINMINKSSKDEHFLYVTPLLSETDRIVESCEKKDFKAPQKKYNEKTRVKNKKEGLLELLRKKENIVTTHALFHLFNEEMLELCRQSKYTLVLDESADVISEYKLKPDDFLDFMELHAEVDAEDCVHWVNRKTRNQKTYEGEKFLAERELCELGGVTAYKDSALLYVFPLKVFDSFAKTYVLTYLFEGQMQRYYYDFYGVKYKYLYVKGHSLKDYEITDIPQTHGTPSEFKSLIHICDHKRLNAIGEAPYSLSKSWFEVGGSDSFNLKDLKNNMRTYFWRMRGGNSANCLWSVFNDFQDKCSPVGYSKSFLSCNTRASNDYRNTENLAYAINLYLNPYVKNFFGTHYIEVDDDMYSLSTMIQWIWRSRIRDGGEINVYVPSLRMRTLFENWLDNKYV